MRRGNMIRLILASVVIFGAARWSFAAEPWEPPLVTMQTTSVAPMQAFEALGEKVGVTFEPSDAQAFVGPDMPGSIDVDIKDQPFWLAVQKLCELSHTEVRVGPGRTIRIGTTSDKAMWGDSQVVASGPVVFVTSALMRTASEDLREPVSLSREARLDLAIFIDPRVRTAQSTSPMHVSEAVDDKQNALKQLRPEARGTFQNAWCLHQAITLALPENVGTRLPKLSGEMHFCMDAKTEDWEIKLPLTSPVTRTVGGFVITVNSITQQDKDWNVKISYKRGDGDREAFAKMTVALADWIRRLELRDEQDRQYRPTGWGGSHGSDEHSYDMHLSADQQEIGPAIKMVWPLASEIRELAVPFEFTDLPLE